MIGLALGVGTYREVLPVFTAEPVLYSIFDPHLTCAQATHLSKRVVERLGYALSTSEASGENETRITATRGGAAHGEKLAVKIVCGNDGVHVEAIPDVSPVDKRISAPSRLWSNCSSLSLPFLWQPWINAV